MKALSRSVHATIQTYSSLSSQEQALIKAALDVRFHAQAPYSHFLVGAAVRDQFGTIHTGCNVERCSWTQTTHAEQNAIDTMIATTGPSKIGMIAVAAASDHTSLSLQSQVTPIQSTFDDAKIACGHCLQIIWENCSNDPSVKFLSLINHGEVFVTTIGDMLPFRFGPESLGIDYSIKK